MKKRWVVLLILCTLLCTSCDNKSNTDPSDTSTTTAITQVTEESRPEPHDFAYIESFARAVFNVSRVEDERMPVNADLLNEHDFSSYKMCFMSDTMGYFYDADTYTKISDFNLELIDLDNYTTSAPEETSEDENSIMNKPAEAISRLSILLFGTEITDIKAYKLDAFDTSYITAFATSGGKLYAYIIDEEGKDGYYLFDRDWSLLVSDIDLLIAAADKSETVDSADLITRLQDKEAPDFFVDCVSSMLASNIYLSTKTAPLDSDSSVVSVETVLKVKNDSTIRVLTTANNELTDMLILPTAIYYIDASTKTASEYSSDSASLEDAIMGLRIPAELLADNVEIISDTAVYTGITFDRVRASLENGDYTDFYFDKDSKELKYMLTKYSVVTVVSFVKDIDYSDTDFEVPTDYEVVKISSQTVN